MDENGGKQNDCLGLGTTFGEAHQECRKAQGLGSRGNSSLGWRNSELLHGIYSCVFQELP